MPNGETIAVMVLIAVLVYFIAGLLTGQAVPCT